MDSISHEFVTLVLDAFEQTNMKSIGFKLSSRNRQNQLRILRNGKQMKWLIFANAKPIDMRIAKIINPFRKIIVDGLLGLIIPHVCAKCHYIGTGSSNLFSDYDISVVGTDKAKVVKHFNQLFETVMGITSAELVDTNVYTSTYFELGSNNNAPHAKNYTYIPQPKKQLLVLMKNPHQQEKKQQADMETQRMFAFVKLFLYLPKKKFKKEFLQNIDSHHMQVLNNDVKVAINFLSSNTLKGMTIADRNRKYEFYLEGLDKMVKKNAPIHKQRTQQALASYYGIETLYTYGAVIDIVAETQLKVKGVQLTSDEYMDSFIENAGEMFKAIGHVHGSCEEKIVEMTKYMSRMLSAMNKAHLASHGELKLQHDNEEVRSHIRGKNKSHRIIKDAANMLLNDMRLNKCDMSTYTQIVYDIVTSTIFHFYRI